MEETGGDWLTRLHTFNGGRGGGGKGGPGC